jgi:hypothetical protein
MGRVAQILSQQEIGLVGLYPNLLYFQAHGNCLQWSRKSYCRSAGPKVSALKYSSQKGGEIWTDIRET